MTRLLLVLALVMSLAPRPTSAQVFADDFETGLLCPWSAYSCVASLTAVASRLLEPQSPTTLSVCVPEFRDSFDLCTESLCDSGATGCQLEFTVESVSGFFASEALLDFELALAEGQEVDVERTFSECVFEVSGDVEVELEPLMQPPCSDARLIFGALGTGSAAASLSFDGGAFPCNSLNSFTASAIEQVLSGVVEAELEARYQAALLGETYCGPP